MAKGNVTEEDLQAGLKSLGGLGKLSATGARRDSPFGPGFVKSQTPETSKQPAAVQAIVGSTAQASVEPARAAVVGVTPEPSPRTDKTIELERGVGERAKRLPAPEVKREIIQKAPSSQSIKSTRKSDRLTERVTLQMSPEMRDAVNELATKLQRKKTDKSSERITANTVMRVAIQAVLDNVDFEEGEGCSSEEELVKFVTLALRRR